MAALHCQRQSGHSYSNGQRESKEHNGLARTGLLIVDCGAPRSEIVRKPIKFLLDLNKQEKKVLGQVNENHDPSMTRCEPVYSQ